MKTSQYLSFPERTALAAALREWREFLASRHLDKWVALGRTTYESHLMIVGEL